MDTIHPISPIPALAATLQRFAGIDPHHAHLTEEEAAACLQLQPKTLESWRREGRELPFLKIGRSIKYRLSDVLACLDRNTFHSSREARTRDRRAPALRRNRSRTCPRCGEALGAKRSACPRCGLDLVAFTPAAAAVLDEEIRP